MGKYSTTAMTENGFDPYTHLLQQGLNLIGSTDKFGNKLKADGIWGPKTQWAIDVGQTIGDLVGFNGHGTFTGIAENSNQVGSPTLNEDTSIQLYHSIKKMFPDLDIKPEDFTRQTSLSGTSTNNHKMGKNDLRNLDNIRDMQKPAASGEMYIAAEQLTQMGWVNVTDDMVRSLNDVLNKYDITTTEQIRHFLAQTGHETKWGGYGNALTEKYNGNSDYDYFESKYGYLTAKGKELGNEYEGDGSLFRGTGYIHLTGRFNYQAFADAMGDQLIMQEGYERVQSKYAWEAAGWFWDANNINVLIGDSYSESTIGRVQDVINYGESDELGYRDNGDPYPLQSRVDAYKMACEYIK